MLISTWTDIDILVYIEYGIIVCILNLGVVVQVQESDIFAIADTYRAVIWFVYPDNPEHIQVSESHGLLKQSVGV